MTNLIIMKDRQAVTSSLNIAENFDKRHDHVLRDIDALEKDIPNFGDIFFETTEPDLYGRKRRVFYMNRDGFTLLAMGFTGRKALQFKLKYIEAFNQMESHIKQQLDASNLSPEIQFMNSVVNQLASQELATKQLETKIDSVSEIVSLNTLDWRKNANSLVNQVVRVQGGGEAHRTVRNEIYKEVERRAGANLSQRVTNKRRRMADEGICKSKRDKLNQVDAIADDKRLVEIYLSVVKDFAIKHKVWNNDF